MALQSAKERFQSVGVYFEGFIPWKFQHNIYVVDGPLQGVDGFSDLPLFICSSWSSALSPIENNAIFAVLSCCSLLLSFLVTKLFLANS
jgi:hypothetical protein